MVSLMSLNIKRKITTNSLQILVENRLTWGFVYFVHLKWRGWREHQGKGSIVRYLVSSVTRGTIKHLRNFFLYSDLLDWLCCIFNLYRSLKNIVWPEWGKPFKGRIIDDWIWIYFQTVRFWVHKRITNTSCTYWF